MRSGKFILTTVVVLALSVGSALASKASAKMHKLEGTVVSMTDSTLVLRVADKRDKTFKIDSSTQKSAGISAGNKVTVNYHEDGKQHIATDVSLSSSSK